MRNVVPICFGLLLLAMLLVSEAGAAVPVSPSPVATASPLPATPALDTASIVWARAVDSSTKKPTKVATSFVITDAHIYAALPVDQLAGGSVVQATWSYNGTVVPELTSTITTTSALTNGWIEFDLARPSSGVWPTGELSITIAINGQTVATSSVEVTVPPS